MRRIGNRAVSWLMVAAVMAMLSPVSMSFAAAWNVPTNVRIVQKSNTDTTGRIYGTIQAAINSITNASASNPYVVKVMPGVYDLGTASLQMKDYVNLEGSGPDNTIITSTIANAGDCTVGTVQMANNCSISHLKVVNTSSSGNEAAALAFNNVKAKAEGINVLSGSDSNVSLFRSNGVCVFGPTSNALLNNVSIETHNNQQAQSNPIMMNYGGNLTLTNSKLVGVGINNTMVHGINSGGSDGVSVGTVTVINSTIDATSSISQGIYLDGYNLSISNSFISMNIGQGNEATALNLRDTNATVVNTKITSTGTITYYGFEGTHNKIANSLIQGGGAGLTGVKLINNFDENFNPIPNQ